MKRVFFLIHEEARKRASEYALKAPDGQMVVFSEPSKKRAQEERYHAMVFEIAKQTLYAGKRWSTEDMKRILVDEFIEEMKSAGSPIEGNRIIPSEDGQRIIQLGFQTRNFTVRQASDFIEFLLAWGLNRSVTFAEP